MSSLVSPRKTKAASFLLPLTFVLTGNTMANAQTSEIEISETEEGLTLLAGTTIPGRIVSFVVEPIEIVFRGGTAAAAQLDQQCDSLEKMISEGIVDSQIAQSINPIAPLELAVTYRPVSPGWSERWVEAYSEVDIPEGASIMLRPDDNRPEVVGVEIELLNLSDRDEIVASALDEFMISMNELIYQNRSVLRSNGTQTIPIRSLIVACEFKNGGQTFKYRVVLKGQEIVTSLNVLDGKLDRSDIENVEAVIIQDTSPEGSIDDFLQEILFVRIAQRMTAEGDETNVDELRAIYDLSELWVSIVSWPYRPLSNPDVKVLLNSLVIETYQSLYFQHAGQASLEIVQL